MQIGIQNKRTRSHTKAILSIPHQMNECAIASSMNVNLCVRSITKTKSSLILFHKHNFRRISFFLFYFFLFFGSNELHFISFHLFVYILCILYTLYMLYKLLCTNTPSSPLPLPFGIGRLVWISPLSSEIQQKNSICQSFTFQNKLNLPSSNSIHTFHSLISLLTLTFSIFTFISYYLSFVCACSAHTIFFLITLALRCFTHDVRIYYVIIIFSTL